MHTGSVVRLCGTLVFFVYVNTNTRLCGTMVFSSVFRLEKLWTLFTAYESKVLSRVCIFLNAEVFYRWFLVFFGAYASSYKMVLSGPTQPTLFRLSQSFLPSYQFSLFNFCHHFPTQIPISILEKNFKTEITQKNDTVLKISIFPI